MYFMLQTVSKQWVINVEEGKAMTRHMQGVLKEKNSDELSPAREGNSYVPSRAILVLHEMTNSLLTMCLSANIHPNEVSSLSIYYDLLHSGLSRSDTDSVTLELSGEADCETGHVQYSLDFIRQTIGGERKRYFHIIRKIDYTAEPEVVPLDADSAEHL